MKRLPPLTAVEAFVQTARLGSVKSAALALSLSSPALTRRIQTLERFVGRPLFERRHQSVSLNSDGERLLAQLNEEFVIASGDFAPLLDRGEREMAKRPDDRLRFWWLRAAWLPSTRALREDPRFYRLADRLGFVPLWEARGFPIGCRPAGEGEGRRLQCPGVAP